MSSTTPTPVTPTAPVWRPMTGAECLRYPWAEAIADGEAPEIRPLRVRFGAVTVDAVAIRDGERGLTIDAGADVFEYRAGNHGLSAEDSMALLDLRIAVLGNVAEHDLVAMGLRRAEVLS